MTINQTITPLPTPPSRQNPTTFSDDADEFLGALPDFGDETNTMATEMNSTATQVNNWADEVEVWAIEAANDGTYASTSSTSNSISTGEKTFTLNEAARSYIPGTHISVVDSTNAQNSMIGSVVSYSDPTLVVNITVVAGSGTLTSWDIGLSSFRDAETLQGYTVTDLLSNASMIQKPSITDPTDGETDFTGAATSSAYASEENFYGTHSTSHWQCASDSDFTTLIDESTSGNLTSWTPTIPGSSVTFYLRVRYGSDNHWSQWSDTVSATTPATYIATPTLTVPGSPSDVQESPTLTTSAFSVVNGSDTHASTDWQILDSTGTTTIWESLADASNLESITVPTGELSVSTEYQFRVRHTGTAYGDSAYDTVTATTSSSFGIDLGNIGTAEIFESAATTNISASDLSGTQVIVCYTDSGNSNYGTACILDISGSTITAGTPVVFESASTDFIAATTLSSTKAIVCYRDIPNTEQNTACVLDISGSTITAGTPVVFEAGPIQYNSITTLSSTKVIACYEDQGNSSYITACVLDISGSTITAGTPVVVDTTIGSYISATTLSSTKAIVTYRDAGNSNYGTACVLDISGSTITAGTPAVFESASTTRTSVTALSSTKAIVCYQDIGDSNYGTACVLDISGSTITAGTPVVFESADSYDISVTKILESQALVCYRDLPNSNYGTACVLDISGSTITAGTPVVFESASTTQISAVSITNSQAIVCYRDSSTYGSSRILG